MGNCFGARVTNHHSQTSRSTKPRNPETSKNHGYKQPYGASGAKSYINKQPNGVSSTTTTNETNEKKLIQGETSSTSRSNHSTSTDKQEEGSSNGGKVITVPNLKMFTLSELKSATRNFRPDTVVGEGGFGSVFKGWIEEKTYAPSKVGVGMAVAVKKSNPDSSQGLEEWQAEVKFLGKFSHPNLVKLLGYCWEEDQFLLVYEYMQKGSLENHLFRNGAETLSWEIRLKIAIGAAQGLAFLHNSEKSVIYRDFKTSNILLDTEYNAKLSDFGLAKLGPINGNTHVTTRVMGTFGYAAPEYVATGHLYVKSDVYGFGVVLLELLTGLRAVDATRPSKVHNLVDWAKPSLCDKRKLKKIIDPRLEEQYPINIKAAMQVGELILHCLESHPQNRPSMEEVLDTLITVMSSTWEEPRESSRVEAKSPIPIPIPEERTTHHRNNNSYHKSPLPLPLPLPLYSRQGGPSSGV